MVAKIMRCAAFLNKIIIFICFFLSNVAALEIIRDTELEQYTEEIVSLLLKSNNQDTKDFNIYFVKSDQINAFVTGGKNIFIKSIQKKLKLTNKI